MAEKMSTGLCNALLDTSSLKAIFSATTAELRIYGGTVPATADAAPATPTPIATVKEGGAALTFAASASAGTIAKSANAWTDSSAAGGTATFYRLVLSADANDASATAKRIQGTIGVGGADMNVGSTTIAGAAVFTVNTFTQSIVPS